MTELVNPAEIATLFFNKQEVTLEKRTLSNANLSDAFKAVQIYRDAILDSENQEEALHKIGLDEPGKIKLFCKYLGNAVTKNRARGRGIGHEFEINQVDMVYKELLPRFVKVEPSQRGEKGGKARKIKDTNKWEDAGFDQRDIDDNQ